MPTRRTCLECGMRKGVRVVTLYDDTNPEVFTSRRVHYCQKCLEKIGLVCPKHGALKLCMRRIFEDESSGELEEDEESAEDMYTCHVTSVDACPFCAYDEIAAIPADERKGLQTLVGRLGEMPTIMLHLATHIPKALRKKIKAEDRHIFSLALSAQFEKMSVQDLIFEIFREQNSTNETQH